MMRIAAAILALATLSQAKIVLVGPGKPFSTVGAAVQASLPLSEDLIVLVSAPTGSYSVPDAVAPTSDWNGYYVHIRGFKNLPMTTVYVEDEVVYEFNGDYMEESYSYVHGLEVEGRTSDGSMHYFAKDHLGSTRVAIDIDAQSSFEKTAYYSYGRIRNYEVSASPVKLKFTGKEQDSETGLDYFGARYYDPDLGMWISADPLHQHYSLYDYSGGNPIARVDPDGKADGNAFFDNLENVGTGATITSLGIGACATIKGCVIGAPMMALGVSNIFAGMANMAQSFTYGPYVDVPTDHLKKQLPPGAVQALELTEQIMGIAGPLKGEPMEVSDIIQEGLSSASEEIGDKGMIKLPIFSGGVAPTDRTSMTSYINPIKFLGLGK